MIGAVHAGIGAAVGSLCRKPTSAFLVGLASHAVADAVPHRDYPPKIEIPLMTAVMLGVAATKGLRSTEFWGALGAILPDIEHGLALAGLTSSDRELFPTHLKNGKYHGPDSGERWSQLVVSLGAVLVALAGACGQEHTP